MAKQQPDNPKKNQPEANAGADAAGHKKTQLSKKASQPAPVAKKSPQPTQLAPSDPKGPDTPPPAPRKKYDDDDVVEAEAVESDVVEAQPVSDVVEAEPASGVVEDAEEVISADEVEAGRDAGAPSAPESPVKAKRDDKAAEVLEDAVGGALPKGRPESSVRVKGKKTAEIDIDNLFDSVEEPADQLERTASLGAPEEESSSVNLGGKLAKKGSSAHAGVDEVAEELESGVKLISGVTQTPKRKSQDDVDLGEMATEETDRPSGAPLTGKAKKVKKDFTDPDMHAHKDAAQELADEMRGEDGKTVEEAAAEMWNETEELAAPSAKGEPTTPVPGDKTDKAPAAEKAEDEAAAESAEDEAEEAPAPRRRGAGGTAVMTRPPRRPKYGRRLAGGILIGLAIAFVALIGLRYVDPDLLESVFGSLPGVKQPKAADELKSAKAAAQQTRDELTSARNAKDDVDKDLEAKKEEIQKLDTQVKSLAANDKAVQELRAALVKKMIINDKTDVKDFGNAIAQALANKEAKEKTLQEVQQALVDAKLIAATDKLDAAAVTKIVTDLGNQQGAVGAVNKLLEGAMIKEGGAKGVQQLLTAKKDADDKLTEINKALAAEKIKGDGAAGIKEIVAARNQLQKDRDELDKAITDAYKELVVGQFAPATGNPRQQLLEGAKIARQRGESPLAVPLAHLAAKVGNLGVGPAGTTKNAFEVAALMAELSYYRLREPLIQSPEQKLDTYLSMYQRRAKGDAAEQATALKDAAWVLSKEAKASATAKAKAHAVRGLILRNQEKFGEAKDALQSAVAAAPPSAGAWAAQAKVALAELNDPTAYYLPYIGELRNNGLGDLAKQELDTALKAMPGDGRLLAQRALFQLEAARGTGKLNQTAVRQDADAAMKDPKTASEGTFVMGLLEEQLGNYAQAEQLFRQALKTHQGAPEEAARYRIALARVLQRDRTPTAAPAPPAKKVEKNEDASGIDEVSQAFPLAAALLVGQVIPDDVEDPAVAARLNESVKLAKELIGSANPKIKGQGHMLLGQALAKQGLRTEGIREYMKGVEMLFPGMASKEMIDLVNDHPAFQQPDVAKAPSAYVAEVHFGKGLHHYWSRQYPEAEDQFRQAAGFYGHDARYLYFLGMAQYAQKTKSKRDAANLSFEKGAKLEADNRPSAGEINASLERVQGELRKMINSFRTKAIELRN